MASPPKSANMVRRDSFLARAKVLQGEIDVRTAQLKAVAVQIAASEAAIENEAKFLRAEVLRPDVMSQLIPGASKVIDEKQTPPGD